MKKFLRTLICLALIIQNSFCDQKTFENLEQIVANLAKQLEGQSNQLKHQEHLLEHQSKQLEHHAKLLEQVLEQVKYFPINF
jgi:hypothetical protein